MHGPRVTGRSACRLYHPTPTRFYPVVPLPLTLQLLSSSADRMMVPHFFPGTPLGEEKMNEWRARKRKTQPECSLNQPSPPPPAATQQICPKPLRRQSLLKHCGSVALCTASWASPGPRVAPPLLPESPPGRAVSAVKVGESEKHPDSPGGFQTSGSQTFHPKTTSVGKRPRGLATPPCPQLTPESQDIPTPICSDSWGRENSRRQ